MNSIPAFYDEKASFGPYQFTEFAVYDTPKEKRIDDTQQKMGEKKDDLVQYIATAHHAPYYAVNDAEQWVAEGMNNPYTNYTGEKLTEYAKKTESNLKNLKNMDFKKNKTNIALK